MHSHKRLSQFTELERRWNILYFAFFTKNNTARRHHSAAR